MPAQINGAPVVEIGWDAFEKCYDIYAVRIPDSVEKIDGGAFQKCSNLKEVSLSKNLKSIGIYAFEECRSLKEVSLPNSLIEIGSSAFSETGLCSISLPEHLKSVGENAFWGTTINAVNIPASVTNLGSRCFPTATKYAVSSKNKSYRSVDGALFSKDMTRLLSFPLGITGRYVVPESVLEIAAYCFMKAEISSVVLPQAIRNIPNCAFSECKSLSFVELPNCVTNIGRFAFDGTALTSIVIPESVVAIGKGAFENCGKLEAVSLSDTAKVDDRAFEGCKSLMRVTGLNGKTYAGSARPFKDCPAYDRIVAKTSSESGKKTEDEELATAIVSFLGQVASNPEAMQQLNAQNEARMRAELEQYRRERPNLNQFSQMSDEEAWEHLKRGQRLPTLAEESQWGTSQIATRQWGEETRRRVQEQQRQIDQQRAAAAAAAAARLSRGSNNQNSGWPVSTGPKLMTPCPLCKGTGFAPGGTFTCSRCNGLGHVQ